MNLFRKTFFIILFTLLIDHILKIYVKTHFKLGGIFPLFSFFWIVFIENPGMAYGMLLGKGYYGKILLSVIRFFLIIIISFFHFKIIKKLEKEKKKKEYLIIPTSLILSGAIGNFLDSALYGSFFDKGTIYNKENQKWMPYSGISRIIFGKESGYATFMEGCVVDLFFFHIKNFHIPGYIPFFGGDQVQFFQTVFNFSDVIIFIGIILLIFFKTKIQCYGKFF
ncbi:lipoprotein signal peptidase [Blattabacterium cuenoti]|uniref:lipoprotein signal peptidase n=1 Tax=Blattabacterium cuenoti TaxID=1653831 RepID=UPI00163BC45C|nr:lipoprotein signal peptidase [Blattabacterium cuenoti]